MPIGMMILQWSDRGALETMMQYPANKDMQISSKTLLHLINLHGFSEKAGLTTLNVKRVNILTYYSGSEKNIYVVLVLNLLEDADDFEEEFKEIALKILNNLKNEKYKELIPDIYERLKLIST